MRRLAIFKKTKPVPEHEAEGEIEQIYYDIRQTLRIAGIPQMFCLWAGYGRTLPLFWNAFRPTAESRAFEAASDRLRAMAVRVAEPLGKLDIPASVKLGESQIYHLRAALDFYHYLYPKLLILTSAIQLALEGEQIGKEGAEESERIERGVPAQMIAMELAPEESQDPLVRTVFEEVRTASSLPDVRNDLRTLALWPDYLIEARKRLKLISTGMAYQEAAERLYEFARMEARDLPHPIPLSKGRLKVAGQEVEEVAALTMRFEHLYPGFILDIVLLERDWKEPDELIRSPFPAATRPVIMAGGAS